MLLGGGGNMTDNAGIRCVRKSGFIAPVPPAGYYHDSHSVPVNCGQIHMRIMQDEESPAKVKSRTPIMITSEC